MQWLNGLYKEGLLDPGVFTQASDQYDTKNAGKDIIGAYMSFGTGSLGNSSIPSVSIPNLTGPDGKDMFIKNNVTRGVGFSIPRTNKTPEVLLRWYDYLNSSLENVMAWDRGEENLCWKWKDSSKDSVLSIYRTTEDWKKLGYDSESDARSRTSFAGWSPALYTQAIEKKFDSQTLYPSSDVKLAAVEADLKHGVSDLPTGTATASNASQRSLILTDMNNYLKKFISDSVINGIDDAKWKAHLQKLKDLKADTYKQLCQEYVDGVNKLKTSSSK